MNLRSANSVRGKSVTGSPILSPNIRFFSNFEICSPSGMTYRAESRDLPSRQFYCSDEMGLGKTIQAIAACALLRHLGKARARSKEMTIYAGSINRDHIHMLIGIPPKLSVSKAVQYLKGKSSHKLLSAYRSLRKRYWGQHLWARGYWVATSGNVTDEVWKEYIKSQTPPEPDDDFHVV
jgi:putative transposase